MTKTFQQRLERAKKSGSLTTADLSIWFARPYATVRGWIENGYEPWSVHEGEISRLLDVLETAIRKKRGFPLPSKLSPFERREHVTRMRHELNGGLSQTRAS